MSGKILKNIDKCSFYDRFSHELRTTLTGVIGFSEYIEYSINEPMMKFAAEVVHQGGQEISRVMNAYFDIYRRELGDSKLQLSSFNALSVLEDVMQSAKASANHHSVKLVLNCDDEFWEGRITSDIDVFHRAIDLLIQDFIGNANKEDLIQIGLKNGEIENAFILSFFKSSQIEANKTMSLYENFWLNGEGFRFEKQKGPGACAALAKSLFEDLSGKVHSAVALNKSFRLEFIFPINLENS